MTNNDYTLISGIPGTRIRANVDGTYDRHYNDGRVERVVMRPCDCGCGRVVEGGMMELAHPEDYRYDERA